jgi:hypothetical protein
MKSIMYNQGAEGAFAYLGPNDLANRSQMRMLDDSIPSLQRYLKERFKGRTLTYDKVLEESYMIRHVLTSTIGKH